LSSQVLDKLNDLAESDHWEIQSDEFGWDMMLVCRRPIFEKGGDIGKGVGDQCS
jgi:hypothetical protein